MKPSIPKGTRDFGPLEMARRNYIFDTVRAVFRKYGYAQLETPAMENLSTLLGKYGEEGDKLLFRILDSGDFTKSLTPQDIGNPQVMAPKVSEKGLRYDLTVPFARYVVQHQNEITFPFKRYQIQPVWRADRPQKGRYREFYQCDVDVVGSSSLLNEVELIQITAEVFGALGIGVTLKVNNRKVLAGVAEIIGHPDKMTDLAVAIDKLDKIGLEAVNAELAGRGFSAEAVAHLEPVLGLSGSNREKLEAIGAIIGGSETGMKGVAELTAMLDYVDELEVALPVELDLSLARGLNYYTGAIFEVKANDFAIGSISGGGRYDDLTGIFGMPGVSGVGISFGADRIYDVMLGLGLFPEDTAQGVKAIFVNFGAAEEVEAMKLLAGLRAAGVPSEIYPEAAKMKKQFEYASRRGIPYMVFVGGDEIFRRVAMVKNIVTGVQQEVPFDTLVEFFQGC